MSEMMEKLSKVVETVRTKWKCKNFLKRYEDEKKKKKK